MLLGVSVALGQSYTERSKKLSDLIRWGEEQARVTLVLDNSPRAGGRPVARISRDEIYLTRNLRRDGKYWFELNNKVVNKNRVVRLLSQLGVDPDNMLIIMHQNMVGQFTVLSPEEKLKMVEAAVGLKSYRQNVLRAQQKLSRVTSQEESVSELLESAKQTLSHWREQYDRYQQKKQLRMKRRFLERELAWAKVAERDKTASDLKEQVQDKKDELTHIEDETKDIQHRLEEADANLEQAKDQQKDLFQERLRLERQKARDELRVSLADQKLKEIHSWTETYDQRIKEQLENIEQLEIIVQENMNPVDLRGQLAEIRGAYEDLEKVWNQRFNTKTEGLKETVEDSSLHLEEFNAAISDVKDETDRLDAEIDNVYERIMDQKIGLALLQYRKKNISGVLKKLERELKASIRDLEKVKKEAGLTGPRIVPMKTVEEIIDEMRETDGHLAALADVSEDIERMYESYSKLYLELKEKARLVAENREKALEEVKERMKAWRTVIKDLFDHVNRRYQRILSKAQAIGKVRLVNENDIEEAGLQILVGFKGAEPVPLDAYTQSGGERSTATMSFLLALQRHIDSTFRAVDEYDVHMDPRNREIIANMLVSSVKGSDAQYLAITPSQLAFTGKDVHIITVQNVEGTSLIKEVV
ncbi:hypothetical protein GWN63_01895 [Candidatus Bathyarchaeota archaeon]|nr:hypothetical protein [Candidatus Bathyarchaeota archaeon]NIU80987.1 hypothetical protein [Candidatus Bathyarchaeota archaeon]NIV67632.1 hypothetical protein [Candidatus Bathyarchaeota archaeon]NIW16167.1 hypothetical protein [Candidatus Bathyarchaeota archaeon]NIW34253.1 hypothetical protein [Candidatus Bathyarchaeota archaeon]